MAIVSTLNLSAGDRLQLNYVRILLGTGVLGIGHWALGLGNGEGYQKLIRSITNLVCSTCLWVFQEKLKVESGGVEAILLEQWFQSCDRGRRLSKLMYQSAA
ncbi:hypothetical protein VF14_34405 [Nostoc linckia z18]|uniref:Uncharacterized protein n=2 Tax=Nostoc linckia TaxID=92942 RepID=A0A9Q5Z4J4_NOSLI|nr:hypothetical protein [Nostoc linckia]PHK31211.1 hypothetical protein VF12_28470 [Nostoc linckia z15]PHK40146.1 hypothetical protein VF13_33370 [Nostoc linckia z16]PHJ67030.1 hypothetical protein VF02_06930 [Nostoc linckia z1]PHJ67760.1 hypothetical protein VF05_17255 [Nostoc linckia z3]PHJ77292.1 hypothetical protein VF03_05490 [Nostoc linckia z2]